MMISRPRQPFLVSFGASSAIAFTAAALIVMIGGWQIIRTHDALLAEAKRDARTLVSSLTQHAARTVEGVDLILSGVQERVEAAPSIDYSKAYLQRRVSHAAQVRNIIVMNAAGDWIADSVAPHAPLNSVDRDYFLWHRDHDDRGLHVGATLNSRYGGKPAIPLSRRITNADGSFGGVVVAAIMPDHLQAFYETVHIGAKGSVALYTVDGHLLVRYPSAPDDAHADPERISAAAKFFMADSDVSVSRSPFDGVERIFAFKKVDGYPLVVSVGIAVDDALAPWRNEASTEGSVLALAASVLVALGLVSDRHRRRTRMIEQTRDEIDRRYQLLAENSSDVVALKPSFAGPRSYVSPSCRAILGWDPAEFAALSAAESIHPDDLGRVAATYGTLSSCNPRVVSQHRLRHSAGHYVWVESVYQLTGQGTSDQSVIATARDVSIRRDAEEALRESETRYRILAVASSDMISRIGLDGRRSYVSPASIEILGYHPDDMIEKSPLEFMHPEDIERVGEMIHGLATGRCDQARSVHRARHKNGHDVWVDVQFRLVRDSETGNPIEIVSSLRDVTERETLQRQLEDANRHLLMAEELAHVGHWRVNLQDLVCSWSDEVYRMHGRTPALFTPTLKTSIDAYHSDDQAGIRAKVAEAIATKSEYTSRVRLIRADGEVRHVMSRALCEIDEDTGEVLALFGSIMDVTNLVQTEQRLAKQSALLETTLDNMDQALVKVSADGKIELANRRFLELLGLPGELFDEKSPSFDKISAFVAKSDQDSSDGSRSSQARDKGLSLELGTQEHRLPKGTMIEIRTVAVPGGAVVSTYTDITARRLAEAAMRESEARYRILAETNSDVVTQLNLNSEQTYVSPSCRVVLGYEPEDLLGVQPSVSIHPDDVQEVRSLTARLKVGDVGGDRAVTTYRARHKAGHWVWLEAGMNLVRDGTTGAPTSMICSLRDVTERQRAARHLERARIAAEQAVMAKADFMANMSHELRTPLTGILGIHDLLQQDPTLAGSQKRLVGLASASGRSLLNIVNDILDFSKIEAGQLTIEAVPFDLRGLVTTCQALGIEGLRGKAVGLTANFEPDEPGWFVGDPSRLQQVLLNLITNAGKFTERGMIDIDVTYDSRSGWVRLAVSDTGIGIPADKVPLLFERFSQADASTARRFGGTGLGLAISKHLIELMGGRIGVETREREGSRFWFELPLQPHAETSDQTQPVELARAALRADRILLAEDNLINREIIGAMLTNRGHNVTVVADGAAAVAATKEGPGFDLVLMDVQMPGMDGLTATDTIRRIEHAEGRRRLPIIGLTANALAEDVARCLDVGMDGHVGKPIDWPTLFAAIDRVISTTDDRDIETKFHVGDADTVLDPAILGRLARVIGDERLSTLLAAFATDVERRIAGLHDATSSVLSAQAHSLVSLAGQFGFRELSNLCIDLEAEARQGGGLLRVNELVAVAKRAVVAARAHQTSLAA